MTFTSHTPRSIHPPFAHYSHGIEVPPGARLLFCSGQLGITAEAEIPESAGDQTELCFENITAVLESAGMDFGDVVRINAYVSGPAYLRPYMDVRDRYVRQPPPASTLMVVSGFARPEFKVEVEVVAAKL